MKTEPKAHEKHLIHGTPYVTKDKSPVTMFTETSLVGSNNSIFNSMNDI